MAQVDYDKLNSVQRYSQWAVFDVPAGGLGDRDHRAQLVEETRAFFDSLAASGSEGVLVRGFYLTSGIQATGDFIIWWHAEEFSDIQRALNAFRRETTLGSISELVWTGNGLHRPAEFNKEHLPAFIMEEEPRDWITVYPFVRSYDWYLLEPEKRGAILRGHGEAARDFADVRANTVPSFSLGDYEWIVAVEAPTLDRNVDLMHKMRYTEARLHVREEIPFYTGQRLELEELINELP